MCLQLYVAQSSTSNELLGANPDCVCVCPVDQRGECRLYGGGIPQAETKGQWRLALVLVHN